MTIQCAISSARCIRCGNSRTTMSMMMCWCARSAASAPRNAHQMNSSIATSIAHSTGLPNARLTADRGHEKRHQRRAAGERSSAPRDLRRRAPALMTRDRRYGGALLPPGIPRRCAPSG